MYPGFIPYWKRSRCEGRREARVSFGVEGGPGRHEARYRYSMSEEDDAPFASGGGSFGVRRPLRFLAYKLGLSEEQVAELVREKALHLTREEVPHALTVEVEELGEKVVSATIFVETESQKQIVVGKGGSMVREIGTRARPEVEALLGHPVFLELVVKVKPRWRRDERMLERLGL